MDATVEQANGIAAKSLLEIAGTEGLDDLLRVNLQSSAVKLAGTTVDDLPESILPDFVVESNLSDWRYVEGSDPRCYTSCCKNTQWTCEVKDAQTKDETLLLAEIKIAAITRFSVELTRVLKAKFKQDAEIPGNN